MEQISGFKLSNKLSMIYHHQMDIKEQETTKKLLRILIWWHILAKAGQYLG